LDSSGSYDVASLNNAAVDLLNNPRFQNRNWTLTPPGFEPIYPFDLKITGKDIAIMRSAHFDASQPDLPIWKVPKTTLLAYGAQGMEYEPETIGRATGIWNPVIDVTERKRLLEEDLRNERDPTKQAALRGRISELEIGINNQNDRRVTARLFVERFGFGVGGGRNTEIQGDEQALCGKLDRDTPWPINFWLGAWDPDLLSAYMEGSLQIPYL
jgi:hypothetical protein